MLGPSSHIPHCRLSLTDANLSDHHLLCKHVLADGSLCNVWNVSKPNKQLNSPVVIESAVRTAQLHKYSPRQPMKSLTRSVVGLRSCDLLLVDFSHAPLVFHAMFRMRMGYFITPVNLWFNLKLIAIFSKFDGILSIYTHITRQCYDVDMHLRLSPIMQRRQYGSS